MSAGTTSTASGTVGVAVNEGGGVNVSVAIDADVADCVLFPQALKIAITITKRMMDRKRTVFLQVRDAGKKKTHAAAWVWDKNPIFIWS
jgi:hypothetical protein